MDIKSKNYERLAIRVETKILVDTCISEFLKHHPEFEHMKISQDKIVFEIAKFYLKN